MRLAALRPHILGIAKRLNQMNNEETIFPRRDIYVGDAQNARNQHIHRMSIDCSSPWFKILANLRYGLKTKCFLASMDLLHETTSLGKVNKFSLLSLVRGFAPHRHRKYIHFFTINALLGILFLL